MKQEEYIKIIEASHQWQDKSIEDEAGFLNKLFFGWTNKIISFGNKNIFTQETLFERPSNENLSLHNEKFSNLLQEKFIQTGQIQVVKTLWQLNKYMFIFMVLLYQLSNVLMFSSPLLLQKIILFLTNPQDHTYQDGLTYVFLLFFFEMMRLLFQQHAIHINNKLSNIVQSQLSHAVFIKVLKLSSATRSQLDSGKIVNLSQMDCPQVLNFTTNGYVLLTAPVLFIIALVLITNQIGYIGLIGTAVIGVGSFIGSFLIKKMRLIRKEKMKYSDERSQLLSEYFQGIRLIKYYGWEQMCIDRVMVTRNKEASLQLKEIVLSTIQQYINDLVPIIFQIIVFSVYVSQGNTLTPAIAFTTMSFFNLLSQPIRVITSAIISYINFQVSLKRLCAFLQFQEKFNQNNDFIPNDQNIMIQINQGEFSWENIQTQKQQKEFNILFNKKEKKRGFLRKIFSSKNNQQSDLKKPLIDKNSNKNLEISESKSIIALKNINLKIYKGQFIGVIGQTGSGKTGLLKSMIGELYQEKGNSYCNQSIAYVNQITWLQNATIRENILFGLQFEQLKYDQILFQCNLIQDLQLLPAQDSTEVGEKGINLSGGQKQRLSLARALYADAQIYVIDDCLSALDSHVSMQIYQQVIIGALKHKTTILATHNLSFLDKTDFIIVMKNGEICEQGNISELRQNDQSEFNRLQMNIKDSDEKSQENPTVETIEKPVQNDMQKQDQSAVSITQDTTILKDGIGKIVQEEKKKVGQADFKLYKLYLLAGGQNIAILSLITLLFSIIMQQGNTLWLGAWSQNAFNQDISFYIWINAAIGILTGLSNLGATLTFNQFARKASNSLQKRLLTSVFKSPLSWFDSVPCGRILNRCCKDQNEVDENLPWNLQYSLQSLIGVFVLFSLCASILPLFLVLVIFFIPLFIQIGVKYTKAAREIKRISRITRSPLIHQLSEVSQGYMEIRIFQQHENLIQKYQEKLDLNIRSQYNNLSMNRWIILRIQFLSSLCISLAGLMGVCASQINYTQNPALIGVALNSVFKVMSLVGYLVQTLAATDVQMASIESIYEYINKPEQEADWKSDQAQKQWPSKGNLDANNISYRYREDLPNVLKNLNFSINNHEKIGVIGRTGSGKSSLTLGLLRILELVDNENSSIILDDQNIQKVGLHDLRQRVTMVPQESILFSGSLRFNMDPFNDYSDETIVEALKKTQIWDKIEPNEYNIQQSLKQNADPNYEKCSLPQVDKLKLYYQVSTGGTNFSLGIKQLICIGRAILKGSKILIMDEATASVDELTDSIIQNMIRIEFCDTTVITIAHRLETIMSYDRIMVLSDGQLQEFEAPLKLLNNQDSYLSQMVSTKNESTKQKLIQLANKTNK